MTPTTQADGPAVLPDTAVRNVEAQLALAVILFRVGGLIGMLWVLIGIPMEHDRIPVVRAAVLLSVITVESVLLCVGCHRHRRIKTWWAVADLFISAAGLVWWRLSLPVNALFFMYPYTIITSLTFALILPRVALVLAGAALLALANAVPELSLRIASVPNAVYDAGSYFPNTLVAFVVAKAMRGSARELDEAREDAARYAADRLRLLHARILHDRVLQTLEALASGPWLHGSPIRDQVAQEAVWLRGFVAEADEARNPDAGPGGNRTGAELEPGSLLPELRRLVERNAGAGLRVHLYAAALEDESEFFTSLDPAVCSELIAAVGEVLANIRKHASVDNAALRVRRTYDAMYISVLDHGRGFDPACTAQRTGLRQSVVARLAELGGSVLIESAPGAGTHVEMTLPLGGHGGEGTDRTAR